MHACPGVGTHERGSQTGMGLGGALDRIVCAVVLTAPCAPAGHMSSVPDEGWADIPRALSVTRSTRTPGSRDKSSVCGTFLQQVARDVNVEGGSGCRETGGCDLLRLQVMHMPVKLNLSRNRGRTPVTSVCTMKSRSV